MLMYHVTTAANGMNIEHDLVLRSNARELSKAGSGVYLYADVNQTGEMVEWMGLGEDAMLVSVNVNPDQLLMDEDSLFINEDAGLTIEDLYEIMPPEGVSEYKEWLDSKGGADVMPVDDEEAGQFKIGLIDKYKIKPNQRFPTPFGHYSIATARLPVNMVRIASIKPVS